MKDTMETTTENILNVTLLAPQHKHPTIFARYDALSPGESLTIHNDHDPKPLYYQLIGQRGMEFTWEYLEEGPVWWKVKIRKNKTNEKDESIGQMVANDFRKAEVFKKYGLDFSNEGKKTVKEVCADKGIDFIPVQSELQQIDKQQVSTGLPYNEWELDFLIDFIVNTHHRFVRKNLPEISKYAQKVKEMHIDQHPELTEINDLVQSLNIEMTAHINKEENMLFPYIKDLVCTDKNMPRPKAAHFHSMEDVVNNHEKEHAKAGNHLNLIGELTNRYTLPQDACASYSLLYRLVEEFEQDTQVHIHLENNILFPKAIELEKQR